MDPREPADEPAPEPMDEPADAPWAGLGPRPALDEVIAAYIQAREVGPDVLPAGWREAWLARFPALGDALGAFISTYERMHALLPGARAAPPGVDLPARFGAYELREELGRGGMGLVYRAHHPRLDREVALKIVRGHGLAGDDERRRFDREARAAACLSHPGIVPVFAVGEHDGHAYLTMALVRGGSLATHIERLRARPLAESVALMRQVADAIQHAHERGVLHRDLKPANILLERDPADEAQALRPRVSDFGLAKRMDGTSSQTAHGVILGTASYMAPEQARGAAADCTVATDVHGLGAVLYELLTGRPPFGGDSLVDTLRQVQEELPADPRTLDARVDADLAAICLQCLDKEPGRRYASAAALAADLQRWLDRRPVSARHLGAGARAWRWARRRPERAALALGAAVLAGGLALMAMLQLGAGRERYGEARGRAAEIQASSVYAATHVAQTVRRRLDVLGAPVRDAAARPGLAAMLRDAASADAGVLARDAGRAGLARFIGELGTAQGSGSPYESWFVLDHEGRMLARWPALPPAHEGASFAGRDYFLGARDRGGAVHVSCVYEAEVDHLYKLGLAAAVMDGPRFLGAIVAAVPTGPTLQIPTLHDQRHKVALIARMEPGMAWPGEPPRCRDARWAEHRVIVHPAYPPRARAEAVDAALAARVLGPDAGGMEDYRDPVARAHPALGGSWIAGHAPVEGTALSVVVQRRYQGVSEARQALAQTRRAWLGVLLAAAVLGAMASVQVARRGRARAAA